jgi:hypothetical protein
MPRISELPSNAELTGSETLVVVQDGETRQVALSTALIARHPVSLTNARWIKSTNSPALTNNPVATLNLSNSGGC